MSEPNWWLETYKLLPSTIIGISVAYVAFLQWRTAHTKVMVDLFDKRLGVYEKVLDAIAVSNKFSAIEEPTTDAILSLYRLRSDASFLFGEDIAEILTQLLNSLHSEKRNERELERRNLSKEDLARFSKALEDAGNTKDRLGRQFRDACIPYLRINIKTRYCRPYFKRVRISIVLSIFFLLVL